MIVVDPDVIWVIVVGFIIAFILAVGVGANDVANAFGTSVGAKVLTLRQACIIASLVETIGAVLLGSKVTDTVRKGIIDPSMYDNNTEILMLGNVATLSGSCIWLILATLFKMPVSGTHSIVGATLGFAFVVSGTRGVHWKQLVYIVSSWFVSPVLSGLVSVGLFYLCKYGILTKADPIEPGLRFLPFFYALTFVVNLFSIFYDGPTSLGFDRIPLWGVFVISFGTGILIAIIVRFLLIPIQRRKIKEYVRLLEERDKLMLEEDLRREKVEAFDNMAQKRFKDKTIPKHGSFVHNHNEKVNLKEARITFKPSSTDGLNNEDVFEDRKLSPAKRERSQSLIASASTNLEAEIKSIENKKKRFRSKSESATAEQRRRTYSGTINQLVHRRFVAADKSMILNIEKKAAAEVERKFQEEGRATREIAKMTREAIDDRPEQRQLFSYLQILSAGFGGFAHGGNDVSNAIGPLVSIWLIGTTPSWSSKDETPAPIWVLFFGGLGITIGLWVWGRRVIKTMGEDLAKITPSTGFCIELGAATTVLAASNFGLPISTTHCKVGSVVTVGWARARKNVDWRLFTNIFLAWVLTLPVAGGISAAAMAILMQFPIATRNPMFSNVNATLLSGVSNLTLYNTY